MEKEEIIYVKKNIDLLIKGIDPKSKILMHDDTILISSFNNKLFRDVSTILTELLKNDAFRSYELIQKTGEKDVKRKRKGDFFLTQEEISAIPKLEKSITVSELTYILNNALTKGNLKKLKPTQITSWLKKENYLTEKIHNDGKVFKVITPKAIEIGMTSRAMENAAGRQYDVNLYNQKTLEYILDNIRSISQI